MRLHISYLLSLLTINFLFVSSCFLEQDIQENPAQLYTQGTDEKFLPRHLPSHSNDFMLGMFGWSFLSDLRIPCDFVPYNSLTDSQGNPTSTLNVIAEDGFNAVQSYDPNLWISVKSLEAKLNLALKLKLKVHLGLHHFFNPDIVNGEFQYTGTNDYTNCGKVIDDCSYPWAQSYYRPHDEHFINTLLTRPEYKDIIWGFHIVEEASYFHLFQHSDDCIGQLDLNKKEYEQNPLHFAKTEIPPTNVASAISHYTDLLENTPLQHAKKVVMEANHGKAILHNTIDHEGIFNPQDFLHILKKDDSRQIFFDGSYYQFPEGNSFDSQYSSIFNNNFHYLGFGETLDYGKKYASEVHKVIAMEADEILYPKVSTHFSTNSSIQNGNYTWFQTYTSIIHGVSGIWFWDLNYSWNSRETRFEQQPEALRYKRESFPFVYRTWVGNLARELRFLMNQNVISSDPQTVVRSHTTESQDCIIPDTSAYISGLPSEFKQSAYGIRYTIRTNFTDTYIIATNPLDKAVTVPIYFADSANPTIRNAIGFEVLFETKQDVQSTTYKLDRQRSVDLKTNQVLKSFTVLPSSSVSNPQQSKFDIQFGPLDTKVIRVISKNMSQKNGWQNVWSNYGSGKINAHPITNLTQFYPGEFDDELGEELLLVNPPQNNTGTQTSEELQYAQITLFKYVNFNWVTIWSNHNPEHQISTLDISRDPWTIGDFNGDGQDEILLGNQELYRFATHNFQLMWSLPTNNGIKDYNRFIAGDFDGDGDDDLFAFGSDTTSWSTHFYWENSDFQWGWSDQGQNHAIRPYRYNLKVGDFDGDGRDELLGLSTWATLFHFDNNDWQWGWSNQGSSQFSGLQYPFKNTDYILPVFLRDGRSHLWFIQGDQNAQWSTIIQLKDDQSGWNWGWTSSPETNPQAIIDDWPLKAATAFDTRYITVKPIPGDPSFLVGIRSFCDGKLISMYRSF